MRAIMTGYCYNSTLNLSSSGRQNKTATNADKVIECDPVTELSLQMYNETASTHCFEIQKNWRKGKKEKKKKKPCKNDSFLH